MDLRSAAQSPCKSADYANAGALAAGLQPKPLRSAAGLQPKPLRSGELAEYPGPRILELAYPRTPPAAPLFRHASEKNPSSRRRQRARGRHWRGCTRAVCRSNCGCSCGVCRSSQECRYRRPHGGTDSAETAVNRPWSFISHPLCAEAGGKRVRLRRVLEAQAARGGGRGRAR
jgi:hypothetical protein